jgi:hypothetical protein
MARLGIALGKLPTRMDLAWYDDVSYPTLPEFKAAKLSIVEHIGTAVIDRTVQLKESVTWLREWHGTSALRTVTHDLTVHLYPSVDLAKRGRGLHGEVDFRRSSRSVRRQLRKSQGNEIMVRKSGEWSRVAAAWLD